MFKRFMKEEDGMGTVEIVIIIAVLVGIALIFRDAIIGFATGVMQSLFGTPSIGDDVAPGGIREEYMIKPALIHILNLIRR